jgi:hypothetical protein
VARRSLKPQLNQIRSWVRQGRTDAWIAHQLEVSARDIAAFKREHELAPSEEVEADGAGARDEVEVDLRAEDDALVAAALDAEPEEPDEPEDAVAADRDDAEEASGAQDEDGEDAPRRRRGRRGGRSRRGARTPRAPGEPLEGTFDHGEEGYGLWLDPAVQDDAVYAEHWAGHRPITVVVEPDQVVIRRADEAGATEVVSDNGGAEAG